MTKQRKIIKFIGVDKSFVNVFNSAARCSDSVGFRLFADGTYRATGLAKVENQLYKFWKFSLADVFTNTENFEEDLIINLYASSKFRQMLSYYPQKFDMHITADWDAKYDAYVAKKISLISQGSELEIDFACMELVLGYDEYTQELLAEKTRCIKPGEEFNLSSSNLDRLLKLCQIGTFNAQDTTLNIEASNGNLIAYNENFRNKVDTEFPTNFKRIAIKSKLLAVLDPQYNWHVKYDNLPNGGTKWICTSDDADVITIIGGLVHDDDNDSVSSDEISLQLTEKFSEFLNTDNN